VTPPMDEPRHLQLQRSANRPSGAPRPDPEPSILLHLAPPLIRTQGQQRGSQRRTRCRRLGCPSNDVITPLTEYDQRASLSVLPVAAPKLPWSPAPESATPSNRRKLGNRDGDTRGRARHYKRTRGRSARSSRGYPATHFSRSRHRRRPICVVHALHRACAVAVCSHTNRC
jgi:hypothetical protein